jgi:NADH-quinone oxidoreductase subunit C
VSTTTDSSALDRANAALGELCRPAQPQRDGMPCIEVEARDVAEIARTLRDRCGFDSATFVTAVDHYPKVPRFEVVYQLLSVTHNDRLRITTRVEADSPNVPSVTPIWAGASFMERECFDMFGISFEGHPKLTRLLMPEEYEHYPLRKDFPHQGIEPDRLYREWDERRREQAAAEQDQ